MRNTLPPRYPLRFLRWFCREDYLDEIEGDLTEILIKESESSPSKARLKFAWRVVKYFRPEFIRLFESRPSNAYSMYRSYLKIGWRNLLNERGYSFINIGGLALGITVAMLIGLWVHDELMFDRHQANYDQVAAVLQHGTVDGKVETWSSQSYQLGFELRNNYGSYFKHVVMSTFPSSSILADKERAFNAVGTFMEEDGPEVLSLDMMQGTRAGLKDPTSILLSESLAATLFGKDAPVGRVLKLDNDVDLKVTGVYKDIPDNSSFRGELAFIAPIEIIVKRGGRNFGWVNNWLQVFVQTNENVDMQQASLAIRDAKMKNVEEYDKRFKPELFLYPMPRWHLYSEFKDGVNTGGRIDFVWLFGSIGVFVLLLACINFMNLSTARSQKRSKEVGVRKAIGSDRGQLIRQFFVESLLVVVLAFFVAILLVRLSLPVFNTIAGKNIQIQWMNPWLWLVCVLFIIVVTFISGSYPSLYLSAFSPAKVLKGTFKFGRYASLPRRALVVVQFVVSVVLVIGTIVVYQQIQYARNRPVGYQMNGLVTVPIKTKDVKKNYAGLRNELLAGGKFSEICTSETTITNLWWSDWGFQWKGKDPSLQDNIFRGAVDFEFGKTIGWKIKEGRDFSREYSSDSSAMILNEAAVKYMGLTDPIGETIGAYGKNYTVIGVVEDMVTQSLYETNKQTVFMIDPFNRANFINLRISPQSGAAEAIEELNHVFMKHNPGTPFDYTFADDEFANKFAFEVRMGRLVGIFAVLAIVISCLGLFGLASFVAELRTKEIGIRKVLGASVLRLWQMLASDFVLLVVIACVLAIPIGYVFASDWLKDYDYRTEISVWVFIAAAGGALLITLATVSFQALKAAMLNPVKSLKVE